MLTAAACAAALLFRAPLRARYWAWRIAHADGAAEQITFLSALWQAGDAARWGIRALLADERAEVRRLGLIALQHARFEGAERLLLERLGDSDDEARALAALGLAMRGDERVIPTLQVVYRAGGSAGCAACLALQRLGSPAAVAALNELAEVPAQAAERAALADALADLAVPDCVPGLLALLDDQRPCPGPPVSVQRAQRIMDRLFGQSLLADEAPAASTPAQQTVAERAAAGLGRITGLTPAFSSESSEEQLGQAVAIWKRWYAEHAGRP